MKYASFLRPTGTPSFGRVDGDAIIELASAATPDLKTALSQGALTRATPGERFALSGVTLLPVIPNPTKIFCVGHNYESHRQETGRAKVDHPSIFTRFADTLVAHGQPILRPKASTSLDYEGELAVVIGRAGRAIPEARALEHVAGYAAFNDASVRDWQWHTSQFTPGKNFAATGAFGPWMVTTEEIEPGTTLSLTTRLNGQVMQQATTQMMIFPIPRLIAYCSTFVPLESGDVIVTGTPGGVGTRRNPPIFMKPGDVVEVEVDRIGCLRNTIAQD